jgi:hypothetical protein
MRTKPPLSQVRIFTRSQRRDTKTKRWPEYASCASSSCTMPISPSIDFLMSMGVEPMKIRTDRGMVITGYSAAARARR